ncbi:MAG TPA: pyridoxal-phosphate dependent enzyme, partial [Polyangiaceae bacterium]
AGSIDLKVPSPVRRLSIADGFELWVKDDGRICDVYGGNKPRKLAYLLAEARRRDAKRLVTVGALGSHHVLATGLLGQSLGLPTLAVSLPRPYSRHAEQTTNRTLAAGVELVPLATPYELPSVLFRLGRRGDFFVPPGGSNALGARGYIDAARELGQQIESGELPEPDHVVVALGSGGTAAGLLAGLAIHGVKSHLMAVPVLRLPSARKFVTWMAKTATRQLVLPSPSDLSSRITIDDRWIGAGYGHSTTAGELAISTANGLGLKLESTYTGKAFACALAWLRGSQDQGNVPSCPNAPMPTAGQRILFWSTFSSVSFTKSDRATVTLPPYLNRLFRSTK